MAFGIPRSNLSNVLMVLLPWILVSCFSSPTKPSLKTKPASEMDARTIVSGGTIMDDGGSDIFQKGTIISHSSNPTMNPLPDGGWGIDGSGSGSWDSLIIGTVDHTGTIYVRAYAINGAGIGYGDVVSYTF